MGSKCSLYFTNHLQEGKNVQITDSRMCKKKFSGCQEQKKP